ncbi:MAG: phosphatase PAP2 family protein [Dysgonamonadaceae bacterium]|nr:phosphatase PAP2 family protein [Dysgonamonadaceae bacterium]MDD4727672.1 phosphatase PAP2 family protein [Dysgonamonadaceae bacterium]
MQYFYVFFTSLACLFRKRPFEAYPDRIITRDNESDNYSPSLVFNLATSLTLSFSKWQVAVPMYVWASSVTFSRMYLSVHYLSDLLGGIIMGKVLRILHLRIMSD